MDESDSSQPAKCPCGFWGSSKTLGLCSRCYQEHIEKSKAELEPNTDLDDSQQTNTKSDPRQNEAAARLFASSSSGSAGTTHNTATIDSLSQTLFQSYEISQQNPLRGENPLPLNPQLCGNVLPKLTLGGEGCSFWALKSGISSAVSSGVSSGCLDKNNANSNSERANESSSSQPSDATTESYNSKTNAETVKRSRPCDGEGESPRTCKTRTPQPSKKRCFKCSKKLNLAQRMIGKCKCEYVFCTVHRMPKDHNCDFDHKEDGRSEQRKKMTKPHRHVGTSCKRIDSETK